MNLNPRKLAVLKSLFEQDSELYRNVIRLLKSSLLAYEKAVNQKVEKALSRLKNGKDGRDGKDGQSIKGDKGDRGEDGESIEGPPGPPGKDGSPDTPEQVKAKLKQVGLKIEDVTGLPEALETINGKANGGVTNLRIQQAFKYILKTEQPSGAIDGANTTYTVSQPIFAVLSMSINGETIAQLPNYTINGKTFTFSTALPSAYSGKDFEIKYI